MLVSLCYSLFVVCCCPLWFVCCVAFFFLGVCASLFVIRRCLFVDGASFVAVCCLLFLSIVACCLLFVVVVSCLWFVVRCPLFVVCCMMFVACLSFVDSDFRDRSGLFVVVRYVLLFVVVWLFIVVLFSCRGCVCYCCLVVVACLLFLVRCVLFVF